MIVTNEVRSQFSIRIQLANIDRKKMIWSHINSRSDQQYKPGMAPMTLQLIAFYA